MSLLFALNKIIENIYLKHAMLYKHIEHCTVIQEMERGREIVRMGKKGVDIKLLIIKTSAKKNCCILFDYCLRLI